MDGTLLDSMHIWASLGRNFLRKHRISVPPDFSIDAAVPSVRGAVEFMNERFAMNLDVGREVETIYAELSDFYGSKVTVKPGVRELLDSIRRAGIAAGVVTATEPFLAELALRNSGLLEYFPGGILSGAEHNLSKSTPEPFMRMTRTLNVRVSETIVFEDALYAVKCAAAAGFAVAAVADGTEPEQEELCRTANWYCRQWTEFPLEIFS